MTTIDDEQDKNPDESLADELGIEIHYAPEEFAQPVDRERLRDFINERLPKDNRTEVIAMIANFRSWHDALAELLRQDIEKRQTQD